MSSASFVTEALYGGDAVTAFKTVVAPMWMGPL